MGWVAQRLLARKAEVPLDPIAMDEGFQAASSAVASLSQAVGVYNDAVAAANAAIASKKGASRSASQSAVESALRKLQATKARHQPDAETACRAHAKAMEEKAALEGQKEAARQKLDEYAAGHRPLRKNNQRSAGGFPGRIPNHRDETCTQRITHNTWNELKKPLK